MEPKKTVAMGLSALLTTGCATTSAKPLAEVAKPKSLSYEEHLEQETVDLEETQAQAIRSFAYRSAALLLNGEKNLNYSPISLYAALSLASLGADTETAKEMHAILGDLDQEALDELAPLLYNRLYFKNSVGQLTMASSIWADPSVQVNNDFVTKAASLYYAEMYQVDFSKPEAQKAVNAWVAKETNGLIKETQAPNEGTILSILQTVCFIDEWMEPFYKEDTETGTFQTSAGQVPCDFMNRTDSCNEVSESEAYIRSSLGFKNGAEMIFVLPKEGHSVNELVESDETIKEALEGGESKIGEVVWSLPKFTMTSSLDLIEPLKQLGMNLAFSDSADFSKLLENTQTGIGGVSQESMIEVDENGAKAGASTRIDFMKTALMADVYAMNLDRPFLYAISYNDVLLFVGVLEDPTK